MKEETKNVLEKYPNSKEYVDSHLVKDRYCSRCGSPILKSDLKGYPYQCVICDEDLFEFETFVDLDEQPEIDESDYVQLIEETAATLLLDD